MFTKEEILSERAVGYAQQYFADMRFTSNVYEPSIINSFLTIEQNGKEIIDSSPQLDIQDFKFRVSELDEGIAGQCDTANKVIIISLDNENDDIVLLHEMIHAFEYLITECTVYSQFHDVVLLCLYNDLKMKIPDLDERILRHSHIVTGVGITMDGGEHDVLFLLKSYDLDLKLELPLGIVCGYGRDTMKDGKIIIEEKPSEKLYIARNAILMNLPIDEIINLTGLTLDEVEGLRDKINN